jgi:hypothetical protein
MVRILALLGGPALIATIILVARFDKNYNTSGHSYNVNCVQASQPSPGEASLACAIKPVQNTDKSETNPPWWHILITWTEGITTWAIIGTGFVIAWQAIATQQAANVGKTAAKAALGQIDIMKAKDRAHLTVNAIPPNLPITDIRWKTTFEIENIGSTHASGIVVLAMFEFAPFGITPPIPTVVGIGSALHLRGSVDYRDIFGDQHMKPFRFIWVSDMESMNLAEKPNARWIAAVHSGDPKET